ncbi:kynureninase [Lichenicoccus sp.]|uniref:kynureninase n=1 Tax=Lichenicoccus sp. TaxID=2781899 RepID=UPI003D1127BC
MTLTLARLQALDEADPLAAFRAEFRLPEGVVYLDGNSLGPLPCATAARIAAVVEQEWGGGLIRSWNDAGWIDLPGRLGDEIGSLLGAPPDSVLVADSTSVNLFKLLAAALTLRPGRTVILTETGNFPTDLYVAEGLVQHLGARHVVRRCAPDALVSALGPDVAVLMLTHVNYRTGAMHDMAALTAAAHRTGTLVLWDLAHSAGAVPVDLAAADVDFAVGCGYKFLNGGPGAPAFLHVAPRLQAEMRYPLTGWLGHADPFGFDEGFRPAAGIGRAAVGTPSILGMAALQVGVGIASRAPMPAVRAKSLLQSGLLMDLVAQECPDLELELVTPRDPARRGSQVSLRHPHAWPVMQALVANGVIGDFRSPDILRFGITPLTLRHADLWRAVAVLRRVLQGGEWRQEQYQARRPVT